MNSETSKKIFTLESVSASVDSVSTSVKSIAESIKLLATKEEIKNLVTKEEIKNLATKDDLRPLASKGDLYELRAYMGIHFAEVRESISYLDLKTTATADELERQMDNLAITSSHQLKKINIKLDEMDKHVVEFKQEFGMKLGQMQNQLDNVYTNYPNRNEFVRFDDRLKKVEEEVFA